MAFDVDLLYGLLHDLLDCACTALDTTERGCPDDACVVPGAMVIEDNCCPGQLRVLAEKVYQSRDFPNPATAFSPCQVGRVTMDALVSLRRCAPAADCDQQSLNAALLLAEGTVLWRALMCCIDAASDVVDGQMVDMRPSPNSPTGGCVGWDIRLKLGAPLGCGCDELGLG